MGALGLNRSNDLPLLAHAVSVVRSMIVAFRKRGELPGDSASVGRQAIARRRTLGLAGRPRLAGRRRGCFDRLHRFNFGFGFRFRFLGASRLGPEGPYACAGDSYGAADTLYIFESAFLDQLADSRLAYAEGGRRVVD